MSKVCELMIYTLEIMSIFYIIQLYFLNAGVDGEDCMQFLV